MFCTIRQYQVEPGQMDELMHRIDATFCGMIENEPGFAGYEVIDCGNDVVFTISTFTTREGAEGSTALAATFVRDELSDIAMERLNAWTGEAKVSRGTNQLLEPAHA